jgi:superfamily II RNA helicase
VTQSTHRNGSPLADADESSAAQSDDDHKRQEQKQSLKSESSPVRREAAQDRLERPRAPQAQPGDLRNKSNTNNQENEMKDAFAAEPPSTVPVESNRDAVGGPKRRDMPAASQALPEPLQKESLSAVVVDRQNSQLQTKADEASAKPKNQVMPAPPFRRVPLWSAV